MKTLVVSFICLFIMACSATKRCPPAVSYPTINCISDSATIKGLLVGTWDWVKESRANRESYPCETGRSLSYHFDSLGNYQYINNGTVLINGRYFIIGNTQAYLYDSNALNDDVYICNGCLFLTDHSSNTSTYIRRN